MKNVMATRGEAQPQVEGPHQPKKYSFPARQFGNKGEKRSFKVAWFDSWKWIDYHEVSDSVTCYYCSRASTQKLLTKGLYGKREEAFLSNGFTNWKDACASFRRHEMSKYHLDAVQVLAKPQRDVGEMLSQGLSQQKKLNSRMLLVIVQTLQFLTRQALALRGHDDGESNFIQLLKLRSCDQAEISEWLAKKGGDKYTSPEIQNEILTLMSQAVLCEIARKLQQAEFFTIMTDECVDCANNEQLAICIRYVDDNVNVHEEFIGLYQIPNILANTIVAALQDTLVRLNLNLSRCRGQCYDGAGNMSGCKTGVKAQIQKQEPRALYTHCYGHALSLSIADTVRMVKSLGNVMDTVHELSKLLQYSPKRSTLFKDIKGDISPDTVGFRVLCPTRWTVRNETFRSILDNYNVLLELWDTILNDKPDSDTRARVNGIDSQMKTFDFYFGASLLCRLLSHTDNLSKTLQHTAMSAAEGQHLVRMTTASLKSVRTEEMFNLFWQNIIAQASKLDIGEPTLPRRRKAPRRYEVGESDSSGVTPCSPQDHYRVTYFEAIDTVIGCISDRFQQEGYRMYCKVEQLLLKTEQDHGGEVDEILKFYGSDFEKDSLLTQLHVFHTNYPMEMRSNVHDIASIVRDMSNGEKALLSQVIKLVRLLLVMPATNAISERSFSAMRRVKTYLRSTMSQKRLNSAMVLHIHKDLTDSMDLKTVCREFISKSDYRKSKFSVL